MHTVSSALFTSALDCSIHWLSRSHARPVIATTFDQLQLFNMAYWVSAFYLAATAVIASSAGVRDGGGSNWSRLGPWNIFDGLDPTKSATMGEPCSRPFHSNAVGG